MGHLSRAIALKASHGRIPLHVSLNPSAQASGAGYGRGGRGGNATPASLFTMAGIITRRSPSPSFLQIERMSTLLKVWVSVQAALTLSSAPLQSTQFNFKANSNGRSHSHHPDIFITALSELHILVHPFRTLTLRVSLQYNKWLPSSLRTSTTTKWGKTTALMTKKALS